MKRYFVIAVILGVTLGLFLTGCGKETETAERQTEEKIAMAEIE